MKPTISLAGVFPPIPTPFDGRGDIDHGALTRNLERWNEADLAGYVVLGSNGEAVYLTEDEKLAVWRTARAAIPGDKLLVAGTGCESTRYTIALTQKAADLGADAALVLTPHYYGSKMSARVLVEHYRTVADSVSIPVILYSVPKFTALDMDVAAVVEAAAHPNVVGIKDSGGSVARVGEMVRQAPESFQVLAGSASFFFAALALGAVGGVLALANVAPRQAVDIYRLYQSGSWGEAAELQRQMLPVNTAVTARFGIAGLKAALDLLGFEGGSVRRPLRPLEAEERHTLQEILHQGGLL